MPRKTRCPRIRIVVRFIVPSSGATSIARREELHAVAMTNGRSVGRIIAMVYPDSEYRARPGYAPFLGVYDARVEPELQRCGVGTKLYTAMAHEACNRGYPLASDDNLSVGSQGFWQKQVRNGRAMLRRTGYGKGRYFLSCPAPTTLATALRQRR